MQRPALRDPNQSVSICAGAVIALRMLHGVPHVSSKYGNN